MSNCVSNIFLSRDQPKGSDYKTAELITKQRGDYKTQRDGL